MNWTFSYEPYFSLPNFIDYISALKAGKGKLNVIIKNSVIKLGLRSFFISVKSSKFSEFYAKCRSISSACSKLTAIEISQSFRYVSGEGGLSFLKLFKAVQI